MSNEVCSVKEPSVGGTMIQRLENVVSRLVEASSRNHETLGRLVRGDQPTEAKGQERPVSDNFFGRLDLLASSIEGLVSEIDCQSEEFAGLF